MFIAQSSYHNYLWAAAVFLTGVVFALLLLAVARAVNRRLIKSNNSSRHPDLVRLLTKSISHSSQALATLLVVEGALLALIYPLEWMPESALKNSLVIIGISTAIVILTYVLSHNVGAFLNWLISSLYKHSSRNFNISVASFIRYFIQIAIYIVGLIALLGVLGISITPLITGLGIGGVAVALAAQSTLENFLAGIQITSDNMARIDDFVEIDDKLRGYVVDVGWRSTKIRTSATNVVIVVPNSKLANNVLLNYNQPNSHVSFMLYCGVSYDNDLDLVRELALKTAIDLQDSSDDADKNFTVKVNFEEFGDSNVVFWVMMQAKDRIASLKLKNDLITDLHKCFRRENIRINYPLRLTHPKIEKDSVIIPSQSLETESLTPAAILSPKPLNTEPTQSEF
ncbi:MAG: mechanosensitive ion channel family protein [Dehalococcoidia bacterium]|nr:mechanosensitive ion channel family protein [Dehalococcoidia bacterium]